MKTLVITGSTRGIGYGLADAFLRQGCRVVISGRSQESVETAVETLSAAHSADCVFGCPCEVTQPNRVQQLWDTSQKHILYIPIQPMVLSLALKE